MRTALVISAAEKGAAYLRELLESALYEVQVASTGASARRLVAAVDFDTVVINSPLRDAAGEDLARTFAEQGLSVLLLVKTEQLEEVCARVGEAGVFTLAKPLYKPFFFQALKLVEASRHRAAHYMRKNAELENKIEEIRLVDRAKCTLIAYLNMTEPQAHRYIEKQAMDLRVGRMEIARNILNTYET